MPVRPPLRSAVPASTTRPGARAARARRPSAGAAGTARARRPGARAAVSPAGSSTGSQPDDAQRAAGVEVLDRPRRRAAAATAADRARRATQSSLERRRCAARGTRRAAADLGDPDGAALPRRSGRAGRERGAQDLEPELAPADRLRQPDGAVGRDRDAAASRSAGPASGAARPEPGRASASSRSRRARWSSSARPGGRRATRRSTAARCRRTRSTRGSRAGPRSAADDVEADRPPTAGRARSGAAAARRPAVQRPGARRGRAEHARDAGLAVEPVAHERGAGRAALVGRGGTGRRRSCAGTGTSAGAARPRARSASTGGRSASRASTPGIRSSRIPPAPAVGPVRLAHVRDPDAQRAHVVADPSSSGFQPGLTSNRRPWTSTAVTVARRSLYGSSSTCRMSRGAVERDVERVPVLRQRPIGLPVRRRVAVERRERPPLRELREAGRGRRRDACDPVVDRDGLRVAAAGGERVEHRRVDRRLLARGEHRPGVLRHPRRHEHPPPVGVGDHDLRRAARSPPAARSPA